jgi:transposase
MRISVTFCAGAVLMVCVTVYAGDVMATTTGSNVPSIEVPYAILTVLAGMGGAALTAWAMVARMDERIKIVSYCIANDKNYGETAEKFNVSYQQVYSWIKKYTARGVEGLEDRRGRSEPIDKPVTDIEKLKAELELEKAKNQRLQVENDFLKKLEEIERRRY